MKGWAGLLTLALLVTPAGADEKKKKKKDDKQAEQQAAPAVLDPLQEADAKLAAGDVDGAITVLDAALAAPDAQAGTVALRLGQLREDKGELDLAIDAYEAAGERLNGPPKGEALGRMAVLQYTRGMTDAAATAEAARAADPDGVWPTIAMSRRRAREGQAEESVELARKALTAGGGAAATTALGLALQAKGDLVAAEASFREAMAADPTRSAAVVGLASVLRSTGRAEEAEPLLQGVIETSPGAVEAYKEMARVKMAQGRAQDALGDASIAAAMAENDPVAQRLVMEVKVARALEELAQGQTDLAVTDLTQLRDQNPDSAPVRLGLGRAQVARRDADAALAELQKAVELDPESAEAQYWLGYAQHALKGNAAAAVGPLEKACAADPGNNTYRTALGAALTGAGQADRARTELTRVVETPGYDKADGWFYLGEAHLAANRFKDAIAALDKAVALKPENAAAEAYLAWSYFGLKNADAFKQHGARARRLGWKDARLLDRLKRVEAGEPIK